MKSILISIKPKHCANILNGLKIIEIRKTIPKCELPIDVYIYCTMTNDKMFYSTRISKYTTQRFSKAFMVLNKNNKKILNGKVIAKFRIDKLERIDEHEDGYYFYTETLDNQSLQKKACLNCDQLYDYANGDTTKLYAWHIDNLEIFDTPKELIKFRHKKQFMPSGYMIDTLTKAPQSWCYIETDETR